MCNPSDSNWIKECIDERMANIHFFSNQCKSKREVWVVTRFLSQLGLEFPDDEIVASSDEPADVVFRDARFQVKEILDENRRRHDEYREALQKAEGATSDSGLFERRPGTKGIVCADLVPIVAKKAGEYQERYGPSERTSVDLLFYVNLRVHVIDNELPPLKHYSSELEAWRSVSAYSDDCSFVLYVSQDAPSFIKNAAGQVHRDPSPWWVDD